MVSGHPDPLSTRHIKFAPRLIVTVDGQRDGRDMISFEPFNKSVEAHQRDGVKGPTKSI